MKTEKRLTMALSVLVALMMLAVPLASSSNLFVDGGQTNSNGDAPVLGAEAVKASYTITFKLNADGKSLDQVDVDTLLTTYLTNDTAPKGLGTWYKNENGDLCLLVAEGKNIQEIIKMLYNGSNSRVTKSGYDFISWKDAATGQFYDNSISGADPVEKDMIFEAQWELQSGYVEVPVTVNFDGDVNEYVKAYHVTDGKITVSVDVYDSTTGALTPGLQNAVETIGDLSNKGYVINDTETSGKSLEVYSKGVVTYGDNKTLPSDGKIPSTSSLTVTYTFNEAKYSKIVVSSIAFKDGKDVMLYADKAKPYDYKMILDAVQKNVGEDNKAPIALANKNSALVYETDGVSVKTTDGKYLVTGWNNGAALLESTIQTTATEFTLDAKLNGYNVVFMVNGQYEVKFVEFGKLSEDLCTLDISGLNHWVWIPFNDVAANALGANSAKMTGLETDNLGDIKNESFQTFSFASQSNIDLVEKVAASVSSIDVPSVVFVACFEAAQNTAYAIFDANKGYFGDNENIDRIVMTGKGNTAGTGTASNAATINKPVSNLAYEGKKVFIGYTGYADNPKYDLSKVQNFVADVKPYEHIVTFYAGDEVSAKLYYKGVLNVSSNNTVSGELVAFEYKGYMYEAIADNFEKAVEALQPKKDGYDFIQWNDVDGKKVFSVTSIKDGKIEIESGDGFPKDGIKTDFNVYAQFDAKSYTIKYVNTFEGTQNQIAYVDQSTTLYGTGTFIHEGYDLKAWSTVPGNSGDKYDLGATFVLNGADFEKLAESAGDDGVVIELYSVWEYNGGSDVPGGNTGGDSNDNTALYLIAGMLAVIAILAIVGIVLMRKK